MKKLLIIAMFVLPLMVVGQVNNYRAFHATIGVWDENREEWNWNNPKDINIGIVTNIADRSYVIYAKKTIALSIITIEQIKETANTVSYLFETLDQDGVYVVVTETIPKIEGYAYIITLIYPNFGIRYEVETLK